MDAVVKSIEHIDFSSKVKDHLEFTYADYMSFLEKLLALDDKTLKYFLKTMKEREIINNQEAELEESFLIELYRNFQRKDSIEIAMQCFEDRIITKEEVKKLHRIAIKGSSDDDPRNYNYRSDDNKWVGGFDGFGNQVVDYYPPNHELVCSLMQYTLDFLNDDSTQNLTHHVLIKPFIAHALIAYIQPFGNGNTRVARLLQHAKIWHMSKDEVGDKLSSPALYLSKNYLLTRPYYRNLIRDVAKDNNWNGWLDYNLNMVDEQLFYSGNTLEKVKNIRL